MATGNDERMNECFPELLRMGTARMKHDKDTEEEGNKRRVYVESTAGMKKRIADGLTAARAYRPPGIAIRRNNG